MLALSVSFIDMCVCVCRDLDSLVMNFLVVEGYKEAAECFSRESGLTAPPDHAAISARNKLRKALLSGEIEAAIDLLNDFHPELLDDAPELCAQLKLQHLIECIRSEQSADVIIRLAREQVAPLLSLVVKDQSELVSDFNKAMALLLVPDLRQEKVPKQLAAMLDVRRRAAVAGLVNKALLESAGQECESLLPRLLKLQRAVDE